MTFKNIRITLLLLILGYIVVDSFLSNKKATEWKHPLRVVIYPINADGRETTDKYIATLNTSRFDGFTTLLKKESARYGLNLSSPISIQLSSPIKSLPPAIPKDRNTLKVMWWSLKLRYWTWKTDNYKGTKPQVRAYALFFDPKVHKGLAHSTGLEKNKVALIQLFADNKHAKQNNFIILHELLHTLGATDKYDLSTNQPHFPEGYAEPNRKPTYPQRKAEIMGGRIPLSPTKAKTPSDLTKTVIGPMTAKEIGW